ncbi:MAG: V-type ATP synthase subunit F, partial [candidate division WOR-3 bacterium]|nr:V-type ATP synthase subunit F [candidate division WOR-3 bacterium]
VIGEEDFLKVFNLYGMDVLQTKKELARELLEEKIKEGYKIIFFTPKIYSSIFEIIKKYEYSSYPIFISLTTEEEGIEDLRIRELLKRALGKDIFKEET